MPEPSLEALIEGEVLPLEILHPGGLATTRSLAERCGIGAGTRVLDVASGTGEGACFLAETFGAEVVGLDHSASMIERSSRKVTDRGLSGVELVRGDAHRLPFPGAAFDVAISECTLSLLDKRAALAEMVRVVRPGGVVGIHEVCWRDDTPASVKQRLVELEGERPETLGGWGELFEAAGLEAVSAVDRSELIPLWMRESWRSLGLRGVLRTASRVVRRWGLSGLWRVLASERLFRSEHVGYGIIAGRKPLPAVGEGPHDMTTQAVEGA